MEDFKEKGTQILEALGMAGKKQSLTDQITEQNTRIGDNNAKVAELQKEVDVDNADAAKVISSLVKELDEVTKDLKAALVDLEKEGYKLPIGGKGSKTVSL